MGAMQLVVVPFLQHGELEEKSLMAREDKIR